MTAYPCEIWQYSLRSRGLTVAWCSSVVGIFFNTFVNAIALEAIHWKYYIVFIVMLVLLLLTVIFTYPETKGHTLEQMASIFDGEDAAVPPPELTEKTAALATEEKSTGFDGQAEHRV